MNQSETGFWQLIKKNINGFSTRIENVISSGFPDVVTVTKKVILIELKVEKKGWVYFRSSQIAFFARIRKTGEYVRVMIRTEDDCIMILSSGDVLKVEGRPYKISGMRYKTAHLLFYSQMWEKLWNWEHINKVLFTE